MRLAVFAQFPLFAVTRCWIEARTEDKERTHFFRVSNLHFSGFQLVFVISVEKIGLEHAILKWGDCIVAVVLPLSFVKHWSSSMSVYIGIG